MHGACPVAQARVQALGKQHDGPDMQTPPARRALPVLRPCRFQAVCVRRQWRATKASALRKQQHRPAIATYPEPETEKERSPLDYPQVGQ